MRVIYSYFGIKVLNPDQFCCTWSIFSDCVSHTVTKNRYWSIESYKFDLLIWWAVLGFNTIVGLKRKNIQFQTNTTAIKNGGIPFTSNLFLFQYQSLKSKRWEFLEMVIVDVTKKRCQVTNLKKSHLQDLRLWNQNKTKLPLGISWFYGIFLSYGTFVGFKSKKVLLRPTKVS